VKVSVAKINHMRGVKLVGVTIARRRGDSGGRVDDNTTA
jgi:hypothetical protein